MPTKARTFQPPRQRSRAGGDFAKRLHDKQRGTSTQRGYGSRWQQARSAYLKAHPLCVTCQAQGNLIAATVVDHITPHKGDMALFWDSDNWRSLCKRCHDRATVLYDGGFGNKVKAKLDTK